jgi:hypothetical protein
VMLFQAILLQNTWQNVYPDAHFLHEICQNSVFSSFFR